jgi:hypothetical protein
LTSAFFVEGLEIITRDFANVCFNNAILVSPLQGDEIRGIKPRALSWAKESGTVDVKKDSIGAVKESNAFACATFMVPTAPNCALVAR